MSVHKLASIHECLAKREGMNLVNVKFFRGDRDLLSADELRAEVCRAAKQRNDGAVEPLMEAPRSKQPRINVREYIATL